MIFGNYNTVRGKNNIVNHSGHTIEGNNNVIINGQFPHFKILSDNVIRIWIFDIDTSRVERLKSNPY